jgi:phosphatidylglycerophosphatase C
VKIESVDEVVRRIVLRREALGGGCVAFDADGTLWSGDVGDDLWHAMLERDAFLPAAHSALARVASEAGLEASGSPTVLAKSIASAQAREIVSEERAVEVVAWALAGRTEPEVKSFVQEVLARAAISQRLHPESLHVLRALQQLGIAVYVVSASPRAIVEQAVLALGIEPSHVIAASAAFENDVMVAGLREPLPFGQGKVHGLRQYAPDQPLLAAFGDNYFDTAMLREAEVPVAVRPKPKLRASADAVPGLVELASLR